MTNPEDLNPNQIAIDAIRHFLRPSKPGGELWKLQALIATQLLGVQTEKFSDLIDIADRLENIDQNPPADDRPVTGC